MRLLVAAVVALAAAPAAGAAVVRTTLEPATVLFGEPALAEVAVVAGADEDPGALRIEADFGPFRRLDVETVREGRLVVQRARIACVSDGCRPADGTRSIRLPPARVVAGGRTVATAPWPRLLVAPRVPPEAAAGEPEWRVDTRPPAVTTRIAPGTLASLLVGLALVLGLAAAVLVASEAVRARRRRRADRVTELEAALAAVRASAGAGEAERRRAVGVLARLLGRAGRREADGAQALAWAEPEPRPERVLALADTVEREASP